LAQSGLIQQVIYFMNDTVYIVEINWVIDTAIDWGIDPEIETAIEIASTQTKSAFADSRNAPRVGGFRMYRRGFNRRVFLNPRRRVSSV
jgi:hypothetical protein